MGLPPLSAASALSHKSALSLLDDDEDGDVRTFSEQQAPPSFGSTTTSDSSSHQFELEHQQHYSDVRHTSGPANLYLDGGEVLLSDLVDELQLTSPSSSVQKRRDSDASEVSYSGSKRMRSSNADLVDDDLYDDVSVSSRARAESSSLSVDSVSSARAAYPGGRIGPLIGENRLKIKFQNLGHLGEVPQHFGKKRAMIPDGVVGTHEVYGQRWKWEIRHLHKTSSELSDDDKMNNSNNNNFLTTVQWTIINLSSGTKIVRVETPHEAFLREFKGQTICNQLLRDALNVRANELEQDLERFKDKPVKVANIKSCLRSLRPKKCIMGLLFFGLLHQCVQDNLKLEEEQRYSSSTVPG
jgi:hypothetical protein